MSFYSRFSTKFASSFASKFSSRMAYATVAEKTGALTSRLVPDAATLTSGDKTKLALIAAAGAIGLGTILLAGRSTTTAMPTTTTAATTEASSYPMFVRERLMRVYGNFAGGIALTAATAVALARSEAFVAFAASRPMAYLIGGAVVGIGSLIGVHMTSNKTLKRGLWVTFMTAQGATMLPIALLGGPIVLQAAAATGLMVGSLSAVASVAPNDSFLWMGGGLSIGLTCLVGASFASIFFPGSSLLQNVTLYGGLGLFGAMQLYDTQAVAHKARTHSNERFDPIVDSLGLYMNTINIFLRFVQIFANQGNNGNRRRN